MGGENMRFIRRSAMISLLVVAPILINMGVTSAGFVASSPTQSNLMVELANNTLTLSHYL